MKKLSVLIVCSFTFALNAQQNVFKLGILGLGAKNIKLTYERTLTSHMSFNLGVSYFIPRDLPAEMTNELVSTPEAQAAGDYITGSFVKGISIIPDLRFYSKKQDGAPKGFYYGPYLKFSNYSLGYDGVFSNQSIDMVGAIRTLGIGFTMGKQWVINDKITFDWNFLSIGLNSNTFSIKGTNNSSVITQSTDEWEAELREDFKDVPFFGEDIDISVSGNSAKISSSKLMPAIRTGFSIGFGF